MLVQLQLLPGAISEILASAAATGKLTVADRYGLMAAVLDESLGEEEVLAIARILRSVCRGRVQLVDELSASPR